MTHMLIYNKPTPVSASRHREVSIERKDFQFAAGINSVPLTTAEFSHAAFEYPIVFSGDESDPLPVAILGLESGRNYFVESDGSWSADYIPAFVRRYPFVLLENGDQMVFCLDEDWPGCNREGRGQRLFDETGQRTRYLNEMVHFLEQSRAQFADDKLFRRRLVELNLLVPMKAEYSFPDGNSKSLVGFQMVNREKLKNLPPETLTGMFRSDFLEAIYLHLHSVRNLQHLVDRAG